MPDKGVSVEEQRAQKYDRFLRERQIAEMIYEHFRATGYYEAVQGLSDLFNIRLWNDDVQDFDVRWDHALLSASETPSAMVLEELYKSKLQDSVQLQTVLALYDQETIRNNGQPSYSKTEGICEVVYLLIKRWGLETSEPGTQLWREEQLPRVNKERKPTLRGKWENAFCGRQMDNVPKEAHVVSPMILHLGTDARIREEKDNRPLLHLIQRQRLTGKNPSTDQAADVSPWTARRRFSCRNKNCQDLSRNYWHPPSCQSYKSETGCSHGNKCRPTEDQRKVVGKDQLSCWRTPFNWDACLKNLVRESPFSGKKERWDQITL